MIILLAFCTFLSTLVGGLITVKFKKYLPYFFAFAAGSLIAVSFLDLLPESIKIASDIGFSIRYVMMAIVVSFFAYSLLERFFLTHPMHDDDNHGHIMGPIGSGSLVLHSLLDGVAIGSAFRINPSIGLIVALAVISHDFTDGINTVSLMFKNKQNIKATVFFLGMDAIAPVIGVALTTFINIPQNILVLILAVFVGEFIYIGGATLLPEIREHKSKKIAVAMGLGILLIAVLTKFI
jgi:ZIP family zinc transporter